MSLLKWQGAVKEETILDNKIMAGYKDQTLLLKVILAAITWFVESVKEGYRMRSSDIFKMGLYILEYKADSLEDVVLCFKMAEAEKLKDPETGQKIKRYATMDIELLKKYWLAYLDFKAGLREVRHRTEKQRLTGGDFRTEEDTRLKQIEQNAEFLKEYRAASGQVQRWAGNENLTPLQEVIIRKFKNQ